MAEMDIKKQVVEGISKNFSKLDNNQDGRISKEEFSKYNDLGLPKLGAEERGKYFGKLVANTRDKNSIEKSDIALEKISLSLPLSESESTEITKRLGISQKRNNYIDIIDAQTDLNYANSLKAETPSSQLMVPILRHEAHKDLSSLKNDVNKKMNGHIDLIDAQNDLADAKRINAPGLVDQAKKDLSDLKDALDK